MYKHQTPYIIQGFVVQVSRQQWSIEIPLHYEDIARNIHWQSLVASRYRGIRTNTMVSERLDKINNEGFNDLPPPLESLIGVSRSARGWVA